MDEKHKKGRILTLTRPPIGTLAYGNVSTWALCVKIFFSQGCVY